MISLTISHTFHTLQIITKTKTTRIS